MLDSQRGELGIAQLEPGDPDVIVIACQIGESTRGRLLVIDIEGKLIRRLATPRRGPCGHPERWSRPRDHHPDLGLPLRS